MKPGLLSCAALIWAAPAPRATCRPAGAAEGADAGAAGPPIDATAQRSPPIASKTVDSRQDAANRRRSQGLARGVRRDRRRQLGVGPGRDCGPSRERPDPGGEGRTVHRQGLAGSRPRLAPGPDRIGARPSPGRPARTNGGQPRRTTAPWWSPKSHASTRLRARPLPRPSGPGRVRPPTSFAQSSMGWSGPTTRPAPKRSCWPTRPCCRRRRVPRPDSGRRSFIMSSGSTDARRVADTWRRARAANGLAGGVAVGPRLVAARRLQGGIASIPGAAAARHAERTSGRRRSTGGRAPSRRGPPALGRAIPPGAAAVGGKFYGLVARETLGMDTKMPADSNRRHRSPDCPLPNVRRAIELARIGEPALAEEVLRHQARSATRASIMHHRARQEARPARRAAVARQSRPAPPVAPMPPTAIPTRAGPRSTVARRSRPRLRPHRPGIRLPPDGGQPGRRGRPDAGRPAPPAESRAAAPPTRATLTDPKMNLEYRPKLHRMMRRASGPPANCRASSPPTTPARCRSPLGEHQRQGRSAAVDRIHPLLGDPLLCAVRAAQHVGLQGLNPEGTPPSGTWPSTAGRPYPRHDQALELVP